MSERIARMLPHSLEAEEGLIGCMLIGGEAVIEEMDSRCTPEFFYNPANGTMFYIITTMHRSRMPVDLITVTQELRNQELLEDVGGSHAVTVAFSRVNTAINADQYALIVREKYLLRRIIAIGTDFGARGYDESNDPSTLLEEFQGELIEVGQLETDANSMRHIKEDLAEGLDRIEERYHSRGKLDGLPTGFVDLDRTLDGLKRACVYVFGGRPAMGKSALGMAIAEHVALDNRLRKIEGEKVDRPGVAVFSCEMTRQKLVDRLFASHAEVTREKLRRGMLAKRDFDRLHETAKSFSEAAFFLDATAGLTITKFKSQSRRAVVKNKCGLIVIDHVQHMKGVTKRSKDNRALEIGEIMAGIAETAKNLMVPVIVLAQIGRGAEEKAGARPTMADLKESGAIEEYADAVGLLYRPIYYAKTPEQKQKLAAKLCDGKGLTVEQEEVYAQNYAECILDKNRDGGTGTIPLRFIGEFTRFEDPSGRKLYSNNPAERQQPLPAETTT